MSKQKPHAWDRAQGLRLRTARLKSDLTQQQTADHLGFTYQMYQKLEKGISRLHAEDALKLAGLFKMSLSALIAEHVE